MDTRNHIKTIFNQQVYGQTSCNYGYIWGPAVGQNVDWSGTSSYEFECSDEVPHGKMKPRARRFLVF